MELHGQLFLTVNKLEDFKIRMYLQERVEQRPIREQLQPLEIHFDF